MQAMLSVDEHDPLECDTIIAVSERERDAQPYGIPSPAPARKLAQEPRLPGSPPVSFKIRLANSEGRRSTASYLIQKMYGWRGYMTPGLRAAPDQVTLVASDEHKALGTLSIGFDRGQGLLVDQLYREEVDRLRADGARLCEFTKLAVDRTEQSRELLAMLFHVAYMYARRLNGCTHLLIEVNPRHVRFYQVMLGFQVIGSERTCPRVNAPGVLLCLDLAYSEAQIRRYGGHRELAGSVRSLYPLAFAPGEEEGICGRLRVLG